MNFQKSDEVFKKNNKTLPSDWQLTISLHWLVTDIDCSVVDYYRLGTKQIGEIVCCIDCTLNIDCTLHNSSVLIGEIMPVRPMRSRWLNSLPSIIGFIIAAINVSSFSESLSVSSSSSPVSLVSSLHALLSTEPQK